MQKRAKKLLVAVWSLMIGGLLSLSFGTESVSAYSASMTTSGNVEINVAPVGTSRRGVANGYDNIVVNTDCRSGYTLTVATPEGSDLYKYTDGTQGNTPSFTAVANNTLITDSANVNKWGYSLTGSSYYPLSTTPSVLKTPSDTASSTDISDSFGIDYGINADKTIDPGTYKMANNGSIVYYLTMDATCTEYTVNFNANGGSLKSGVTPAQSVPEGEPTKLTYASDIFTAPSTGSYTDAGNNTITGDPDKLWTFWGWNTSIDGTGDWYKDREEVIDLAQVGSSITLYAQWKQATLADMIAAPATQPEDPRQIDHNGMQDMSPEACYNSNKFTAIGTPYGQATLIDNRDGTTRTYTVAKLPDGLCWMTKNLNLGASTSITLTPEDTDITADFTLPASNPTDFATGTGQANINKPTVLNNMTIPDYTVNSTYSGKIGAYYSYAAATADTNTYSKNSAVVVSSSICPRSWDLPVAGQYYNLRTKGSITTYNNTNASYAGKNAGNEPYYFIYGGYRKAAGNEVNTTYFNSPTTYGYLWTANNSTDRYGYGTYVYSSGLYNSSTGTTYYKYYGLGIRCVASQGTVTITFDGNGSDGGSMTILENVDINSTTLASNGFTRTHYSFKNWNTEAGGTGATLANNASISTLSLKPGDTITLYAQWTPQRQIIYNDNCSYNSAGCATNTDTTNTSNWTNAGSSVTLGSDTYFDTRPGYAITSWNTARDGSGTSYNISSSYTVPSSLSTPDQVTLYAQWTPALTINFNSNGGTGTMTAQLIPENTSKALKSNGFTAPSGNYFIGWMTEESRLTNTVVYANGATYTAPTTVTPGDSITLYAKWGPRYTIVYNGNNATGGSMVSSGTELKHTNINEGANVNLYASNYYKTNYGFIGWSPSSTATVGGTDPIYGPNESISAPSYETYGQEISGTKTITLYAIWLEADSTKTMQTFGPADCQNLSQTTYNSTTGKITAPTGSVIALKDQRDNNVYTVARLADGNCWMTENLRLEAANTKGNNQYDSSATNESLSQGYGGVFTGLDSTENSNFSNTTNATPYNLYNSTNITGTNPGYRFPRYNNNNTNTSLTASYSGTGSSTYYSWYSFGNYYTWAAAMANTTHYSSATGASGSESAGTSLCPANWTLPTIGSTTKDFGVLSQGYGGNGSNQSGTSQSGDIMSKRFRTFPNNFLYSGYFNGSSAYDRGTIGYYWSRSASSNVDSYRLLLDSTRLFPSSSSNKISGFPVRCMVDYTYTIQYDGNNATGGSMISDGVELKHKGVVENSSVDLYPSNYYKDGYGFAGWSTDSNAWTHFTDNDNTNDPVIYGPMETITAPAYPSGGKLTLYAVWVPAKKDGNNNPVYLQNFNATSCGNLTSTTFDSTTGAITVNKNSIVALTDKRDNNIYTVARLADGNCWMTENLRLEAAGTVGNTNKSLSQGYGGVFNGLDSTENDNFTSTTTATPNNLYNSTNITGSRVGYRFPRYNNNNTNTSLTASYNGVGVGNVFYSWYSYGNYYTWAAAMANTTHYTSATGTSGSESAGTSLCPTNWTLPTSGSATKDYGNLSQQYGGTGNTQNGTSESGDVMSGRFRAFPNNFIYSGGFVTTSTDARGSGGYYWSRSASDYSNSYYFYVQPTTIYPTGSGNKPRGHSVRCVIGS